MGMSSNFNFRAWEYGLHLTQKGEYIPPNRAKSPDFSDPNHDTNHQKKGNSLITKISMCYESVLAVFTLHSGHAENVSNVSRARYIVNHQSRQFLQGPITMQGKCMYPPSQEWIPWVTVKKRPTVQMCRVQ